MAQKTKYDYAAIHAERNHPVEARSWESLAYIHGAPSASSLRAGYYRWLDKQERVDDAINELRLGGMSEDQAKLEAGHANEVERTLTAAEVSRITSLDDLIEFFKIDIERWQVAGYHVNKWEQASGNPRDGITVTPLYQVKARLIPNVEQQVENAREVIEQMIADAAEHMPAYTSTERSSLPTRVLSGDEGDPVLFEVAIHDPHIGMLAWGSEVGTPYDSSIAVKDYATAVDALLPYARFYPTERILYVVGHDLLHVDGAAVGPKGSNRGGATTAGTMQDVDTRLAKMFTTARRAVIAGIDKARLIAPVDVLVVPGNHDAQQMYRMGEVLSAWYRNDPEVNVIFGPNRRKYYGFGKNAFMLTHGEEYKRQRDNLALIFATECPAELWAGSIHREIHTGHNHIGMAGRYAPTSELTETRQIRTRSLAGITPEDAWHHEEGYKHRRTASVLAFRKSGGLAGIHEFNL